MHVGAWLGYAKHTSGNTSGEVDCAHACRFWPRLGVEYGWFIPFAFLHLSYLGPPIGSFLRTHCMRYGWYVWPNQAPTCMRWGLSLKQLSELFTCGLKGIPSGEAGFAHACRIWLNRRVEYGLFVSFMFLHLYPNRLDISCS